jgi:hypothetical protein
MGTNWSFNITANKYALAAGDNITLTANLEDEEGNQIDPSGWENQVTWSWY